MPDLAKRIRDHYDSIASAVTVEEIIGDRTDAVSTVMPAVSVDSAFDSAEAEAGERLGDDLMVDYLQQWPDGSTAPAKRNRWSGVVGAVAAMVLVVVGVVVVADGIGSDVGTDPASLPAEADPVLSPSMDDSVPAPAVVDSLGYRWSRVPDENVIFGPVTGLTSVTVGGPGLVAVGSRNQVAAVWTSVDGVAWTRSADIETFNRYSEITDVTVGGPGLVAVGWDEPRSEERGEFRDAAVWTSVDGITWSQVPHDDAIFGGLSMNGVTVGGPGLVAVGERHQEEVAEQHLKAVLWTSVDGLIWSRAPDDEANLRGQGEQTMNSVTVGGPGLVAVGRHGTVAWDKAGSLDGAVWTSADGVAWSPVPHDDVVFGAEREVQMYGVTRGGPGLVAVGSAGFLAVDRGQLGSYEDFTGVAAVWTSVDGITWSRVPVDDAVFDGEGNQWMNAVTSAGSGLVAVGGDWSSAVQQAAVWTSVDGLTWARVPRDEAVFGQEGEGAHMRSVTAGGPGLVAVGWDGDNVAAVWVAKTGE